MKSGENDIKWYNSCFLCDRLSELSQNDDDIKLKLSKENSSSLDIKRINVNESSFRWHLNENQMASFKLAEGIRLFNKDLLKLKELIRDQL